MRRPARQPPRALLLPLLVLVLVPLLVVPAASAGSLFQLTISGQRFTGTPLDTAAVRTVQCAARCAKRADCAAFQTSSAPSCLLLAAMPTTEQLTASAGDSVFVEQTMQLATDTAAVAEVAEVTTTNSLNVGIARTTVAATTTTPAATTTTPAATTTTTTPVPTTTTTITTTPVPTTTTATTTTTTTQAPLCPSGWTIVDTACYYVATPGDTAALWTADSNYCATTFSTPTPATLAAFETEAQYTFIRSIGTLRLWLNIRYVDGAFRMYGGPTGTLWQQKWDPYEPGLGDNGYVFYYDLPQKIWAVVINAEPMPRTKVLCMRYIG